MPLYLNDLKNICLSESSFLCLRFSTTDNQWSIYEPTDLFFKYHSDRFELIPYELNKPYYHDQNSKFFKNELSEWLDKASGRHPFDNRNSVRRLFMIHFSMFLYYNQHLDPTGYICHGTEAVIYQFKNPEKCRIYTYNMKEGFVMFLCENETGPYVKIYI